MAEALLHDLALTPNGSHTPAPGMVPAKSPHASLYCLFAVSMLYFWLSLMALRQASVSVGVVGIPLGR